MDTFARFSNIQRGVLSRETLQIRAKTRRDLPREDRAEAQPRCQTLILDLVFLMIAITIKRGEALSWRTRCFFGSCDLGFLEKQVLSELMKFCWVLPRRVSQNTGPFSCSNLGTYFLNVVET